MRTIEIRDQVRLSLNKCIELVLSGIRFRLFRAAITVGIIALAVAFLMTMLGESIMGRQVASVVDERVAPHRAFLFWSDRVAKPASVEKLTDQLSRIEPDGPRWTEFRQWASSAGTPLSPADLERLAGVARRQRMYLSYFDSLNATQRRPLVGSAKGTEILAMLVGDEAAMANFRQELKNLNEPLPTPVEEFETFLDDWGATRDLRQSILQGHAEAVRQLGLIEKGMTSRQALEKVWTALAHGGETFRKRMVEAGFVIDLEEHKVVANQAEFALDASKIAPMVSIGEFKRSMADRMDVEVQTVDDQKLFATVSSNSGAQWLIEEVDRLRDRARTLQARKDELRDFDVAVGDFRDNYEIVAEGFFTDLAGRIMLEELAKQRERMKLSAREENLISPSSRRLLNGFDLQAGRIVEVADYQKTKRNLTSVRALVAASAGTEQAFMGFSVRTMWLLVVSFVVCIVGIANAMLMSVTERFREIATMKCLGATDGFIMVNFILESIMQGVAGGAIGTVVGFVLGALRGWGRYGVTALESFPLTDMLAVAGISFLIGIVVSALAAVYPAYVAARLAPMEAMRIE